MAIVTLTTDLGTRDPYLALVKAALLRGNSSIHVIDLSSSVKKNNISDAAFILRNGMRLFDAGTVHLVGVKFIGEHNQTARATHPDNSRFLVTQTSNQYIITPDTGLFTLLDAGFNDPVFQLYYEQQNNRHFYLKDVFASAALHLAAGGKIGEIAHPVDDYHKAFAFESYLQGDILRGKSVYVDDFGNIITNISRKAFESAAKKRKFIINLPGAKIETIQQTYDDVGYGSVLALFNSFDQLEIAVNGKSAFKMLCPRDIGTHPEFNLMIEFYD